MKFASIDTICRSTLLQKNYPFHYYLDCLVNARDCLRELTFDDLKVIKTELIDVVQSPNGNYATLPCDYIDYCKIGVRVGQMIKPLVEYQGINRLHNYDSQGAIVNYTTDPPTDNQIIYTYPVGLYWQTTTINDWGENTGRLFGWGAGFEGDTFKVLPERNQIQLNESVNVSKLYVEYISDGMCCDSATQVDSYAWATITAYILWKLKANNRTFGLGEVQMLENEYLKQRKILRARKNGLSADLIKRIIQRNYYASPKS